ncbi:hypothetical protein Tco_1039312 [Tanacetum coccineum]
MGSLSKEYELLETNLLNGEDGVPLSEVCVALHHITPHREWFCKFEKHEAVYTAEETPLTTNGIGFIRLQNEDGTIMTLKGVRYLPNSKKNLIFVGTLESKGFEVRDKAELRISFMTILGEAVSYACHLVNSFPSTAIDEKTLFEKWYGKPATDYDSLQVFVSLHRLETQGKISGERRNAVSLEESNMRVHPPPQKEEDNWMKMDVCKERRFPGQDHVRYKARLLDWELVLIYVKTAFLHGDLEEDIYIVQFKNSAAMPPKNDVERAYMEKVPYAMLRRLRQAKIDNKIYFSFGKAPVKVKSTLQPTTALSTTET